jgi:hypothetical protein
MKQPTLLNINVFPFPEQQEQTRLAVDDNDATPSMCAA